MTPEPSKFKTTVRSEGAKPLVEKVQFLLVGGFNTFFGFGMFTLIEYLFGAFLNEILVLLSAHIVASILAFYLHRKYVFKATGKIWQEFIRFQSVFVVPLSINLIVLPVAVRSFGINPYAAQGLFTMISVIVSYFGHKYFTFGKRSKGQKPQGN